MKSTEEWKKEAVRMYLGGYNAGEITRYLCARKVYDDTFYGLSDLKAYEKVRAFLKKEKKKNQITEAQIIIENKSPKIYKQKWAGSTSVKFGLISDTHINSKYAQLTHLHSYYDVCVREQIKNIYHVGDIDEGEQMRQGHQYECYNQGADDHVEEIVRVYPKRQGISTHFITGNHDASMFKKCGVDIGKSIADKREDMEYLGRDCAIVKLTPNCTLELRHPWDGTAYALSYKIQKMIDAMEADSKPNILAVGHYHKTEQLFYRNIHAFQVGCFQGQTPFTRGTGKSIALGGWICEAQVNKTGTIESLKSEFIPFYKSIQDDYKNWVVM